MKRIATATLNSNIYLQEFTAGLPFGRLVFFVNLSKTDRYEFSNWP